MFLLTERGNMLTPVIKWVGGKRQLLDEIKKRMPKQYNRYFEPFVGGGALFLELSPKEAHINDINHDLYAIYKSLQDEELFKDLLLRLDRHQKNHSEEYYYKVREQDRKEKYEHTSLSEKAARAIYLNKAGYNGLYRVNQRGYFNVPSGHYTKVNLYDEININSVHEYMKQNKILITNNSYEKTVENAQQEDFIYFDPPYDKLENKASFTAYSKNDFNRDDQIKLFNTFKELSDKGIYVMLSNHNTEFIRDLYKDFNIHVVSATRMVNSNAQKRGPIEEVIITNYEN